MYKLKLLLLQGMVEGKAFIIRYEGEYSQRHLEEFRAGRESNSLNKPSILNLSLEGLGRRQERKRIERGEQRRQRRPRDS